HDKYKKKRHRNSVIRTKWKKGLKEARKKRKPLTKRGLVKAGKGIPAFWKIRGLRIVHFIVRPSQDVKN
ncbi:hypothetical protein J9A51_22700, partial [Klebsiella pneumoniae]